MLQRRKLFCFSASFLTAALFANYLPPAALLLPAAIFAFWLVWARCKGKAIIFPLAVLLALALHVLFLFAVLRPVQSLAGQTSRLIVTVNSESASYRDGMSCGVLTVYSVNGQPSNFKIYCSAFPKTEAGERFCAEFALELPQKDEYLYSNYADGIFLNAETVRDYEPLGTDRRLKFQLLRLQAALSARLRENLSVRLGSIASAMVIGDRTHLDEAVRNDFRSAGLSHLLVVSGLHLAIFCGLVWNRKNSERQFSRVRSLLSMVAAVFLVLITGFTPSVFRACIAVLLFHVGLLLYLPPDPLTSLAAAGLLLAVPNFYMVCDVGFQLSFTATIGVLLAAELERSERKRLPPDSWFLQGVFRVFCTAQTAACAALATFPVLLLQGFAVSGVSILGNLLTLWLVSPVLMFGMGTILFGSIPPLTPFYYGSGLCLGVLLRILNEIVLWLGGLPFATLYLPKAYSLLVYAVVACLGILAYKMNEPLFFAAASTVCVGLAVVLGTVLNRNVVTLTLVGTRNNPCAILHENGQTAVVFRGGASNMNAVTEYLEQYGQEQADFLLDLRSDPSEIELRGELIVRAAELDRLAEYTVLPDAILQVAHDQKGNLAVLFVENYSIAVTSGSYAYIGILPVDVLVAGPGNPAFLQPKAVLSTGKYELPEGEADTSVWQGEGGTLQLTVRPSGLVNVTGGEKIVIQ